MKVLDVVQGSPEWLAARLGIPTASCFDRILTPGGKPSSAADRYLHELVAERLLGMPLSGDETQFMQRGSALERQAVAWYEFQREITTDVAGFVLRDDERVGCSPDRLVGWEGGLEIKCPSAAVHVGYLLDSLPAKFAPQCQGAMWVTGREWWDVLSYHPEMPPALARVRRDEKWIKLLAELVEEFLSRLEAAHQRLSAAGGATVGSPGSNGPDDRQVEQSRAVVDATGEGSGVTEHVIAGGSESVRGEERQAPVVHDDAATVTPPSADIQASAGDATTDGPAAPSAGAGSGERSRPAGAEAEPGAIAIVELTDMVRAIFKLRANDKRAFLDKANVTAAAALSKMTPWTDASEIKPREAAGMVAWLLGRYNRDGSKRGGWGGAGTTEGAAGEGGPVAAAAPTEDDPPAPTATLTPPPAHPHLAGTWAALQACARAAEKKLVRETGAVLREAPRGSGRFWIIELDLLRKMGFRDSQKVYADGAMTITADQAIAFAQAMRDLYGMVT